MMQREDSFGWHALSLRQTWHVLFSLLLLLAYTALLGAADPGVAFFETKVRPVLTEHCFSCHSTAAQKHKGGLLLDSRAGMLKGGDSGPALVPGKRESLFLKAVRYTDEDLRMPPKGKLPDKIIADLEKWVALGAPDPRTGTGPTAGANKTIDMAEGKKFWAFQPPRRVPPPNVRQQDWPQNDVDRFLLSRLEEKGLVTAGDADRATLLRRVYFDLIGLPPSPAEVEAFVNDRAADAFARVVDRLLAAPHFGERWGRHWLDVVRYADSSGGGRSLIFKNAWRYRDYVIEAFNSDKPYDRFLAEQVAGDLLPAATPEQRARQLVASAFWVLGPINYEEQDKSLLEMDVIDEQIDTVGRAFLGLTIGCARCHDHKFDPIPTRDYYALAGILHSTRSLVHDNVSSWVEQPLPLSAADEALLKKCASELAGLKDKIKHVRAAAGLAEPAAGVVQPKDIPGIVLDDPQAKKVGAWTHSKSSGAYIGAGYLHDDNAGKGQKTLTFVPEFKHAGRYEVRLAYTPAASRANNVAVNILHADGEYNGHVNQREIPPIDGRFVSLGRFRFEEGNQWFIMISNEGTTGYVIVDALQLIPEEMLDEKNPAVKKPAAADVATGADDREKQAAALEVKKLEEEMKKLARVKPVRPTAMAVAEAAKIEDCRVCIRGNLRNPGELAPRGFLQVASSGPTPSLPAHESGRRQLADWLIRPDNPLTARVMVNRIWHNLFGAGLVRTVDNFGRVGETPSHPELLDFLALDFMANGGPQAPAWSMKKMIRAIVMSRAYQLESTGPAELRGADPENRLLGRMNRRRLDAESIRDAILSASGRLDATMGGPGIKPGTTHEFGYKYDDTRRGVYTPIFRNRLLELFEAFDVADPNIVSGRRNVSTVATQALYLMNNPFVMEEARHAARATLALANLDDAGRVEHAYRQALGRPPTAGERRLALNFLAPAASETPDQRLAAWAHFHQVLFACLDFRYVK